MPENSNEKEKRMKMVHIAFLESEKLQIKEFADNLNMTISEFCRQAIFEKIRKIEHPEMFMQGVGNQIDMKLIESLFIKMNNMSKKQDLLIEKTNILNEMNKLLEQIALYSEKEDFTKEKEIILNLLKTHSSLSQKQLIEMTSLKKQVIFKVVSMLVSDKKITITSNGRFKLA
ncbi:MAG: hypothetical protein ACFFCV_05960 [Promethearchaeota archaeon]